MITHGGESFSLSFEPDVDVFTIFGVLDIRPTHFGHEAQMFSPQPAKSAVQSVKQSANVGRERIFLIMMDFVWGLSMSTEDCICNMGLGCFEWVHYQNGVIIGVEDTTIIIAVLISIPTPIAVE